jgi:hypothetical protein
MVASVATVTMSKPASACPFAQRAVYRGGDAALVATFFYPPYGLGVFGFRYLQGGR